ncbi:hypothetical protein D9619_011083 [Psilocybe cf. subviscida]|uniref:Uncharacterized protein n=1 Tax=Psilocybe cf. subviscida TaxID=2480587 RepID=A0A8H5F5F3_9AGAR|nr:hypothetical protein D9619_011083 [Psilocybe cf. subviscida]
MATQESFAILVGGGHFASGSRTRPKPATRRDNWATKVKLDAAREFHAGRSALASRNSRPSLDLGTSIPKPCSSGVSLMLRMLYIPVQVGLGTDGDGD